MPNTFKSSVFNIGSTADTTLYTTPTGTTSLVKSLYAANTGTADAVSISVSVAMTGGTAAYLIRNCAIPIQTSFQPITEPIVLEANERIALQASAANRLDVILSYLEIT
jgi:hypothetical protein